MARFAALLRAVNVGGTGLLPMATLRDLATAAGFTEVQTVIQSGNLVFTTDLSPAVAKAELEAKLMTHLGKPCAAILRDGPTLAVAIADNPFPKVDPARVAVLFHDGPLADPAAAKRRATEVIVAAEGRLYIHYPEGMGQSRLWLPEMEIGTARNLRSLARIAAALG